MKSYLFGVTLLCVVLAAGCAHKPAVVSDPASSAAAPPAQQVMAAPKAEPSPPPSPEVSVKAVSGNLDDYQDIEDPDKGKEVEKVTIADPLEPFNRAMFQFNDKLYFWFLKPVAQGYSKVVPEPARVGVSNFYTNLSFPIRFVNSLLQANFAGAASELGRFIINTVWGIGGLLDPAASKEIDLKKQRADFGQTLGVYGVGQGFYIHWPLLGPSSPRDTVGIVGDIFLYPSIYLGPWEVWAGARVYERFNDTSLRIGDYESLKEAAIDPYVAVRDAYVQYRLNMIKHKGGPPPPGVKGLLENN
ncbi:MAG: VacJ family lipoprotein [Syntrophales bacterium]|jgi:phospholipid-binding lipoprotein MlaA